MSKNKSLPYLDPELCGLAEGAKILGDRWVLLILREAFYGVTRFETMQAHTHITRQTLTIRLKTMTEMGLLRKVPYREAGLASAMNMFSPKKAVAWRWCCSP